jgi:DNA-binding GntR family transcriptional regulator
MQSTPDARRPNLSEEIAAALRQRIVQGHVAPGVRINEVHLAAELGVSRTPLREALMSLVAEGSVRVEPRRGFFAHSLSIEEFQQLIPIRALLDPAALELAGLPSPQQLMRLRKLNQRLATAADPERIVALDDAWHLELLAHCPNEILLGLIRQFMARTHRYELVLMREQRGARRASRDHARILSALGAGDLARACAELRRNMQSGNADILAWLRRRSAN